MIATPPPLDLALVSVGMLGFRHGFDYDHLAAIADIAATQNSARGAMQRGLLYALGHAAMVAVLGMAVLVFPVHFPAWLDQWMEHVVGITLLALGSCVLWTTFFQRNAEGSAGHRPEHQHVLRTRVMLAIDAMAWVARRVSALVSRKPVERSRLFSTGIGNSSALLVGAIHGLGAETPTQLMLFMLMANLGGTRNGVLGLLAFLAGMLAMNTMMCAATAGMFRISLNRPRTFHWISGLSAAYSILVGLVFLVGTETVAAALGR